MRYALLISVLLHISMMYLLTIKSGDNIEQTPPPKPESIQLQFKSADSQELISTAPGAALKCERSYEGIGVTHWPSENEGWCIVDTVALGGPADRAGIRPKDSIQMVNGDCPGRGPKGSVLEINVKTGNSIRVVRVVRDTICSEL